jgi:hypothetical protein
MPYVMVPVPEEHVLDVMRLVLRRSRAQEPLMEWDSESVSEFLVDSDDDTRAIVLFVARATLVEEAIRIPGLSEALGLPVSTVLPAMGAANKRSLAAGRERILLMRSEAAVADDGTVTRVEEFAMPGRLAAMIVETDGSQDEQVHPPA